MKLHEAIEKVITDAGKPMSARDIADKINEGKLYSKKDGSLVEPRQISARVKNYDSLFMKDGSLITLSKFNTLSKGNIKPTNISNRSKESQKVYESKPVAKLGICSDLTNPKNFCSIAHLDLQKGMVLPCPGLYCVRLKDGAELPEGYRENLQDHKIIYIGKAQGQSLQKRFVGQELNAKGHGTFFRSVGAMLGYKPQPGSLANRSNKNNYTFSLPDESKIIYWMRENFLVNCIAFDDFSVEEELIRKYRPLLNITHNPSEIGRAHV